MAEGRISIYWDDERELVPRVDKDPDRNQPTTRTTEKNAYEMKLLFSQYENTIQELSRRIEEWRNKELKERLRASKLGMKLVQANALLEDSYTREVGLEHQVRLLKERLGALQWFPNK